MVVKELLAALKALAKEPIPGKQTVDCVKIGDENSRINKIAVSMFATPSVIKRAAAFGANLLIVHEPIYYNHADTEMPYAQCHDKEALLNEHGMTVLRFHDHAHSMLPDLIYDGQLHFSGLKGRFERGKYWAVNRFILDEPMTTVQLAKTLEAALDIQNLRIAGARDNLVKTISCCFGTPGHLIEEFTECDTVLTGEICEWIVGEYVRDYAEFGGQKSMIVMGHGNSEKYGMKLLAAQLAEQYPAIPIRYFDSGDLYSYT